MIRAGQRVRREDDVRVGAADALGEELDEAGLVVPALDEVELRAAGERRLELRPVARDRHRRVVRREDEPDDLVGASGERRVDRVGDRAASSASSRSRPAVPSSRSSAARVSSVIALSGDESSIPSRR